MAHFQSDLTTYVNDAREGLTSLARIIDGSIRAVTQEREEKVQGRVNPQLFHAMVRERVAMTAEGARSLIETGMSVRVREADSMQVCIEGSPLRPKILHRPAHGRLAASGVFDFENAELFDQPGKPYIFYSVREGRLARLIVAQVITSEAKFGWACEWIDEVAIYDGSAERVAGKSPELDTTGPVRRILPLVLDLNDEDALDGVVEPRNEASSHELVTEINDIEGEESAESGTSSA